MTTEPGSSGGYWECPCGDEPRAKGSTLTPVKTIVSLREPKCSHCGRPFKEEYRRP